MNPRKTLSNSSIRKLSKVAGGSSFALTVPIEYVRKLGWKQKQKLRVQLKSRHIIIKDWKQK